MLSASAIPVTAVFDVAEVSRSLALLHPAGHTFEVRVPNARNVRYNGRPDPRTGTAFGFFDSGEAALSALPALEEAEWPALYVTLNAVTPALLARASNRIKAADRKSSSTSDHDVERRTALLIDGDPVRPADISATNEEHEGALERIAEIRWFLSELGWPEPITADSGNGGHLVYRVELPAEDGGLVKDFLNALADAFDDDHVHVDRTVFNAARIVKLWGTVARKGDSTADRPHRMSKVLDVPVERGLVTEEMLRAATAALKAGREEKPATPAASTEKRTGNFDVRDFIARHFPDADERTWSSGTRWILDPCPFNADHKGTSAAILQSASGVLSFKCQHDGCAGLLWRDLRERYEPKATRPAPAPTSQKTATGAEMKGEGVLRPVRIADVILEQYDASAWIAPNFLAVGALGILSADYGLGKSTLLSQFGACASSGRDFMGYLVTRPIGCLYWQAEGSRRLFAGRVRDQCRNLGLDLDRLPLHFVPRGMDPLPFDSRDFAEFVTQSGCGLVIFDTFGYFSDGDENSAKDWKQNVAKPLKAIGRATGISFFLVHHEGKPNEFRRGRHKIRGSSAMGGDCDTVLRLERVPDSTNARLLAFDKVKDTEEQPDALLGFNKTTAIFTREGVVESATAVPKEDRAKARHAAKDEDERKAKEGIGLLFRRSPEGLTAEEIRQASGRRREWVATVIDEFHALGYIELGTRERLDSRGRKIRVNVWKWKTAAT